MERILIRAGVAPWAEYNALDVITDKIIGNNTGNLLFANSITRLVATADSRVDFISDLTLGKKQSHSWSSPGNLTALPGTLSPPYWIILPAWAYGARSPMIISKDWAFPRSM